MTEVREEAQLMADNVSKEREGGGGEMSADLASPCIRTEAQIRTPTSNTHHSRVTMITLPVTPD